MDALLSPDVTVLPWPNIPGMTNKELFAAPPWMIEVFSPRQSQTKLVNNFLHAIDNETRLNWFMEPHEKCVLAIGPDATTEFYRESAMELPVPAFATDFNLAMGELVDWLYE